MALRLTDRMALSVTAHGPLGNVAQLVFWRPGQLEGLALWLDADYRSSFAEDVGLIASWGDRSAGGMDRLQPGTAFRPARVPVLDLNRHVIRFSAAQSIGQGFASAIADTFDLMLVVRPVGATVLGGLSAEGVNAQLGSRMVAAPAEPQTSAHVMGVAVGSNGVAAIDRGPETFTRIAESIEPLGGFNLVMLRVGSRIPAFWINGEARSTGIASSGTAVHPTLMFGDTGSGSATTGMGLAAGDVAEIVLVDRMMGEADRQKLEGYLAHRWLITSKLPSAHPYRYLMPTDADPRSNPGTGGNDPGDPSDPPLWVTEQGNFIITENGDFLIMENS